MRKTKVCYVLCAVLLSGCVPHGSTPSVSTSQDALQQGLLFLRSGQLDAASKHFRSMQVLKGENVSALLGLAIAADLTGDFRTSEKAYKRVEGRGSSTAMYLNNVGYSAMLQGDLEKAYTYLRQAKAIDPKNQVVQGNLELLKNVLPRP